MLSAEPVALGSAPTTRFGRLVTPEWALPLLALRRICLCLEEPHGVKQRRPKAIKTLSEVGADQTLAAAADHKQYMAGHDGALVQLQASVKQALLAASPFVSEKQAMRGARSRSSFRSGLYSCDIGCLVESGSGREN